MQGKTTHFLMNNMFITVSRSQLSTTPYMCWVTFWVGVPPSLSIDTHTCTHTHAHTHTFDGLNNKCLSIPRLEAESKTTVVLYEGFLEESVPGLPPWLVDGHLLPVSSCCLSSVHACVQMSFSYMDTCHIALGPNLQNSILTWLLLYRLCL